MKNCLGQMQVLSEERMNPDLQVLQVNPLVHLSQY